MAESLKKYCNRCGAPIAYLHTLKNKIRIPINWDSFDEDERQSLLMGIEVTMRKGIRDDGSGPLHVPHFHSGPPKRWVFKSQRKKKNE